MRVHLGVLAVFGITVAIGTFGSGCGDDSESSPADDGGAETDVGDDGAADADPDGHPDTDADPDGHPDADPDAVEDGAPDVVEDGTEVEADAVGCTVDRSGATHPATLSDGAGGSRPTRFIIEAVDFENDVVVLRNVSAATIAFDSDWRLFTHGSYCELTGSAVSADGLLRVHLTADGTSDADDHYCDRMTMRIEACGGELALLYNPTGGGWSNDPEFVEAFVMWGERQPMGSSSTYNDEAVDAGAWSVRYDSTEDFNVSVCWATGEQPYCAAGGDCVENDVGLIPTGDCTDPAGWTSVNSSEADCLIF